MIFSSQIKYAIAAAAVVWTIAPLPEARAKNLDALTRVLIPAFMVQNFAVLCFNDDQRFLSDLIEGPATISAFAETIKKRVTIGLTDDEAQKVQRTAADAARTIALQELDLLKNTKGEEVGAPMKRWCERFARPFIVEMMKRHTEQQKETDDLLDAAKR